MHAVLKAQSVTSVFVISVWFLPVIVFIFNRNAYVSSYCS